MAIDFTDCQLNKFKVYGGANGSKLGILYGGEQYMLKFPAEPKLNKNISYSNSAISEYIGCHIHGMLGIPAQETLLGTYGAIEACCVDRAARYLAEDGIGFHPVAVLRSS